jgi:hypothetical protein
MNSYEHVIKTVEKLEVKVERKLEKIEENIAEMSAIHAVNSSKLIELADSVIDHVKRTNTLQEDLALAKQAMKLHESMSKDRSDSIDEKVTKLESNVEFMVKFPQMLYKFGKWLSGVSIIGGLLWGLFNFLANYMIK